MNTMQNNAGGGSARTGFLPFNFKALGLSLSSWRTWIQLSLLFLAVALPVAFYLRTYDSVMVKITLLQLGTLAALMIWLMGSLEEGRLELHRKALPFLGPAILLFLWNALRFCFSQYQWAVLDGFVKQEAFLLTFILTLLTFSKRDLRSAVMAICGGWSVTVLYGLAQRLGLDPFIWKGAWGEKVFSTIGNPDFLASYLLFCAPLPLTLALDKTLPLWLRVIAGSFSILGAAVLAWTGATLQVVLCVIAMTMFLFLALRAFQGARRRAAIGLVLLCITLSLFISIKGNGAKDSGTRNYGLKYQSSFLPATWKGTLAMIKTQPLIGSGPGSFWVRYPDFRRPEVILIEHRHNTQTDHPENELLEQWAEGGIVAVLLWVCLFGVLLKSAWQMLQGSAAASEHPSYALGLFTAVVGGLLSMMISISSRFVIPGWLIYFVAGLLGVCCFSETRQPDAVLAVPLPFRLTMRRVLFVPVLAATAWLAWYSVLIFQSDIHHNIAIYWSKNEKWDKALEEYDREVPGSPAYVMGQYFKGNVLQDSGAQNIPGNLERAVTQYRYVRTLAPHYVQVHYQEGKALRRLGRQQEAIEQLEIETTIDPVWDAPWHELSELYRETGQPEKAAAAAQKEKVVKKQWEAPRGAL